MPIKKRFLTIPLIIFFSLYLPYLLYQEVKGKTIEEYNSQQMIYARQAARGIENLLSRFDRELAYIAGFDDIVSFNAKGEEMMSRYYEKNRDDILGISRLDASGRLIYTQPYNEKVINADLSDQKHVREILRSHQPVVSDVFTAVQGHRCIAYHVPVMKNGSYAGSLGILVPFAKIAGDYLDTLKSRLAGRSIMLSEDGVALYCDDPEQVGKNVRDIFPSSSSLHSLFDMMLTGGEGTTTLLFPSGEEDEGNRDIHHAVYAHVDLRNTFWSIAVTAPEWRVLSTMRGFKNKLFFLLGTLVVATFVTSYFVFRSWLASKEEEKRRQAENALRESERNYRVLVEGANSIVLKWDTDGNITYLNPFGLEFLGFARDEIIGKNVMGTIVPEMETTGRDLGFMIDDIMSNPLKYKNNINQNMKKSGERVWISWTNEPIVDSAGRFIEIQSIGNDLTALKEAEEALKESEEKLRRAEKMEAIGALAGGVAHDLNNILSGLVSYPDLLLMGLPEDSPIRGTVLTIKKSGEKAAAIVNDLLTLARRGVSVQQVVNLNTIIQDFASSPEYGKLVSIHGNVKLEIDLAEELLNIAGSPVHLTKTVMNLVMNAFEAMPDGGVLKISTANRYVDQPVRGYDQVEEGDYVVLRVADSGHGISPQDRERVFEPFYTKKVMGRSGTGLGLAVVWGTVKDHQGYIDVQSVEEEGAAFILYFPVTREKLQEKIDSLFSMEEFRGKGESILVVDDVREQRELACMMLSRMGYQVESAEGGKEAVSCLQTKNFDLIILDMIMAPGMDGLDTFKEIVRINPRQKSIIASGYSETDRVREAQQLGAGAYLRKPYTLEKLMKTVQEELRR
ncbi:MAG: response regulator [Pseudomonadota bacterium]